MLRARVFLLLLLSSTSAFAAPWDKPGYTLTFQDECDGGSLDLAKWERRYKWGEAVINGELQAYIDDAFVEQNDVLSIVGKHEQGQYAGQTFEYTSGVISSIHEQTYGYFEARLKMPKGQGLWPAFWLLGAVGTEGVNEIDIQEYLGHEPTKVHMTVHWGPSYDQGHESDGSDFDGPDFSADFHTFGLEWTPTTLVWSIDGVEQKTYSGPGVPQVDMYMILNLAVGGNWPGAPDSTTVFPASYEIDYVRAYQAGESDAGAGGSGGSAGSAANGGATSGGAAGSGVSTGGSGINDAGTASATAEDDSGCGCRIVGDEREPRSLLSWIAPVLVGLGRRRSRRISRHRP